MIEFENKNNALICKIKEQIIASKIPQLREILFKQLEIDSSWEELVFDCSDALTLDSIGVNFVVETYNKTHSIKKGFKIIGCHEPIVQVLKLFKLDEKFAVQPI